MSGALTMTRKALLLLAITAGLGPVAATRLSAQQEPGLFELFAARREASDQPLFGGIALAGFSGAFGLRVSGALHLVRRDPVAGAAFATSAASSAALLHREGGYGRRDGGYGGYYGGRGYDGGQGGWTEPGIGAWSADADVLFEPFRPTPLLRALLLGFSPYGFVGIGATGTRPGDGLDTTQATLSYGAGLHHQLLGRAGLVAEARYRRGLHSDSSLVADVRQKVDYRVGLSVGFGGPRAPRRAAPHVPAIPAPPTEGASSGATAPAEPPSVTVARVLDLAEGFVDTPYAVGGASPSAGFDAAGFVQYVYGEQGVALPGTARQQARVGRGVSLRVGSLRPGDLLFFANDGTTVDHVAIYAGHDRIIHASASSGRVQYDTLGDGERGEWFAEHLVSARRVVGGSDAPAPDDGERDGAPRHGGRPQ